MKDWDDLQTLLALGRVGTMKGAATALGVSETTVARRVRRLAKDNISSLFIRDGQRWTATDLGSKLIAVAEGVEAQILEADSAFQERGDGLTGVLTISGLSFLNTFFLSQAVPKFSAQNPELEIVLGASDNRVSLAFREADIALRLARPAEGRLIGRLLAKVPVTAYTYGPPGAAAWVGLPTELDWSPEMALGRSTFSDTPLLRIDNFQAIQQAALGSGRGGIGPTCTLKRTGLPEPLVLGDPSIRELWIVYHEDLKKSPMIRAAIDWLSTVFPNPKRCLCGDCKF